MDQYKAGNEFLPYHPQASHCTPAYRDGWNHCYEAAQGVIAGLRLELERLKAAATAAQPEPLVVAWAAEGEQDNAGVSEFVVTSEQSPGRSVALVRLRDVLPSTTTAPAAQPAQPATDYRAMWIDAEQRAVRLADALNGAIPVKPEQVQAWLGKAIESATKYEAAAFRKGVEAALRHVRGSASGPATGATGGGNG